MNSDRASKGGVVSAYESRSSRNALTEVRAATYNTLAALARINGFQDVGKPGVSETLHQKYLDLLENASRAILEKGIHGDVALHALKLDELSTHGNGAKIQFYLQTAATLIVETQMHFFAGRTDLAWTYAFDAVEISRSLLYGLELASDDVRKIHSVNFAKKGALRRHAPARQRKEMARRLYQEWKVADPKLTKDKAAETLMIEFKSTGHVLSFETVREYLNRV